MAQDNENQGHALPSPQILRPRSRSPASSSRIEIKNRRKRYLDTHTEYLSSPSLELADPLAYDRLIRRFQTPREREAEGRRKGYSGVLEADLWRSEAKIDALTSPDHATSVRYKRTASGEIIAEEKADAPRDKEEGLQRWRKKMEAMFLKGEDKEFEYALVDGNEEYDDKRIQERDEEERWFDDEEPNHATVHTLTGQTGVQDY